MAKIMKDTKKAKKESAAQAAEDLNVIFPDLTITINGQPVSVLEYPFMTWLEIKSACGDLIEALAEFLGQQDNINADEILEFFENHFHEIQPLVLKSLNIPIQLDQLSDTEMQNLLFAWWQVNKHFFLRSAFRLLRTMTQTPSDGQTSSNALSATDIQAQT